MKENKLFAFIFRVNKWYLYFFNFYNLPKQKMRNRTIFISFTLIFLLIFSFLFLLFLLFLFSPFLLFPSSSALSILSPSTLFLSTPILIIPLFVFPKHSDLLTPTAFDHFKIAVLIISQSESSSSQ